MQIGHYLDFVEASRGLLSGPGPLEPDTSGLQRSAPMFHRTKESFGRSRKTLRQSRASHKYRALLRQVK